MTARIPTPRTDNEQPAPPTRARIRAAAEDLYVLHGYEGFSFGDIAQAVGTTRTNIHHHFGSKQRLMAELIERFTVDAEERIKHYWTRGTAAFTARLAGQLDDLRRFYDRFNPKPGDRNVWSPMSRLRLDLAVLGEPVARALERLDRAFDVSVRHALTAAVAAHEFAPEMPVDEVARIVCAILVSCAPMTQDTGRFRDVEQLFAAVDRTIAAAWGRPAQGQAGRGRRVPGGQAGGHEAGARAGQRKVARLAD